MEPLGRETDPADVVGTPQHAGTVTHGRHPGVRDALLWLCFSHLPDPLGCFSRPFYELAVELIIEISDCPELTTSLNKIIEAKDSAVRAGIRTVHGEAGPVPRPQEVVDPPTFGKAQAPIRPDQVLPGQPRASFENGPAADRYEARQAFSDRVITEFGA
jgi:hypothetical protein